MVGTKAAPQRLTQLGKLGTQPATGQLGQHLGVALASDQGSQHRPTRGAQHVGGDRVELDAGVLQGLLDALALGGMGLDQPLAIPGQVAQLADRGRGHEAAPQQPMLQQLCQPGSVADIGLAAGQDLDVAGVDQQQLEACLLEHLPDRLPILAGGLQHHLGDPSPASHSASASSPEVKVWNLRTSWDRRPRSSGTRTQATTSSLATSNPAQRATSSSTIDTSLACGWCPAGPTDQATLKRVLTATVRGAGKAPASVLSTGSLAPRKAELGRARPILIPRGGPRPWGSESKMP